MYVYVGGCDFVCAHLQVLPAGVYHYEPLGIPVFHIINNPNRQTNNFLLLSKLNTGNEEKSCIPSVESSRRVTVNN